MSQANQFIQLQQQLQPLASLLARAADAVLDQDISKYPIFVIHWSPEPISLGVILMEPNEAHDFAVQITTLEELSGKRIIESARIDNFRQVYKDPAAYHCLFVIDKDGPASFAFMPRPAVDEN